MLSVHPSSPQEESRRQQMHHLLKPHIRAALAPWLEPQTQRRLSVHRKEVPRLTVCPSNTLQQGYERVAGEAVVADTYCPAAGEGARGWRSQHRGPEHHAAGE